MVRRRLRCNGLSRPRLQNAHRQWRKSEVAQAEVKSIYIRVPTMRDVHNNHARENAEAVDARDGGARPSRQTTN